MSGYNLKNGNNNSIINNNNNNNNHISNLNNAGYSVRSNSANNNGIQTGYSQVENDFMNRNLSSVSNHNNANMSVQLTRPTSRIAMLVRQRRAMLEQISCFLCKGYLIDATTVGECMDSFCKSCIVKYLANNSNCPKCGALIHEHNPLDSIRSDKVLQDIVYKMIPGLYDNEMRRRREFYKDYYGIGSTDEEDSSSSVSSNGPHTGLSGEQYGAITYPKPFYKPSDSIDLSIEPQTRGDSSTIYYDNRRQSIVTCFSGSQQQKDSPCNGINNTTFSSVDVEHFKTYLRCPARLTVLQLKKFIAAKFNTCRDDTIYLLYLNESLKLEYSLMDIAYIYDWRGIDHMRLFYIIERDLGRMSATATETYHEDGHSRSLKFTRQSVGMSTQTVKRVCIDPQPRVYEVANCNQLESSAGGRCMRPRMDSKPIVKSVRSTSTQVTQTSPVFVRSNSQRGDDAYSSGSDDCVRIVHQTAGTEYSREQARQTQANGSGNSSAIIDSSKLRRVEQSVRLLRSNQTSSGESVSTIPKVNINPSKSRDCQDRTRSAQATTTTNCNNVAVDSRGNTLVPYATTKSFTATSLPGRTQSSLVTLASFTDTNSNHVMTTMKSCATTTSSSISSNHKGATGIDNSHLQSESQRAMNNNNNDFQSTAKTQSGPQLAFRFVTERGRITIVRRLNPPEDSNETSSSATMESCNQRLNATSQRTSTMQSNLNAPSRLNGMGSADGVDNQSSSNSGAIHESAAGSAQTHQSSQRSSEIGVTPRHQIKVKPVYKTFVDPTKLKSPNLKKLGFTAKH